MGSTWIGILDEGWATGTTSIFFGESSSALGHQVIKY